jgi:HEAT repeat protein
MDIHEIETMLNHLDFQYRLKAISALKDYDSDVAVPLLIGKLHDPEFLVRSFVAMGLGKQQTPESFAALLEIMKRDLDSSWFKKPSNPYIAMLLRRFIDFPDLSRFQPFWRL